MAKILGLDLGTNSIGWAVVDTSVEKILGTGVRIFPEGVIDKGKGEKEKSKNASRTEKRQMRRQFYRKRLRKIKLLEVLIEQGMCPLTVQELTQWKNWDKAKKAEGRKFPSTPDFDEWIRQNPYELREKAIKEEITLYELGRIFYHFIQRRGFLSNRKGKEDNTIFTKGKPEENILPINETKGKIAGKTLGSYLNSISYKEGEPYHSITEDEKEIRVRGRYTVRDMYIDEFEKIWTIQKQFLDIDDKIVETKRIRELKGTVTNNRNRKKIEYLRAKFGAENLIVEQNNRGFIRIITTRQLPLKEFLAGKIERIVDRKGGEKLQFKSNDSVLFWQRPLRSQKSLLSNCRFENDLPVVKNDGTFLRKENGEIQTRSKKPCPVSHPDYELFRAYQFINNISYGKNQRLSEDQREMVLSLINKSEKNFDFKKIPEALKLTYEKFNYEDKHKVPGNPTIKALKPLFSEEVWEKHYSDIWHCFYFYEDDDKLFEKLKKDYGFTKGIDDVKKVRLKDGYGNVSLKAIRNILPFLKKGIQYDKAVILGGVKNAFGKRWKYFSDFHDNIESEIISVLKEDNKEGEALKKIKEHLSSPVFGYGFEKDDPHFYHLYHHSQVVDKKDGKAEKVPEVENLRNPIVQQAVNETRRLVNFLLKKYKKEFGSDFKFDQIKVEMGRDLRNNKQGRQEASIRISENEKKNDEARERLAEYGLQPSRENIQKYLMYREIEERGGKAQCPYTGKVISIADLLGSDNAVQIEHIVPYSVSLDDSFGNKTLCEANFNREKGEKTPYQFYLENPDNNLWGIGKYQNPDDGWNEITERAFRLLPYRKAKKFTSKRKYDKSDFIQRQLNDSRYIAKKSVELLSHICNDVRVMPGQLTAELRHLWGLNNILQPVVNLDEHSFEVDAEKSIPYYVTTDEQGEVVSIQRKQNERPKTEKEEILVPGRVNKQKFSSKYFKIEMETPELKDGSYWAKLNVSSPVKLIPKFIAKPETDSGSIVLKGKVEKGYFKNDAYGRIKAELEDGNYWAKFEVLSTKFEIPQKDKQPKTGRNQLLLYGNANKGEFKCFIYQCKTNLQDGKYWIILDLNPENVEFIKAENPKPEITGNELLITATIDEAGVFTADIDKQFQFQDNRPAGKYFAVFEILSEKPEYFRIENEPPSLEKGQRLAEGNIWIDKYTGEIKFDPKKNRDDHRHHAIDAITIALTEQSYLQQLSTYNAQRKAKVRQQLDSTEKFPEPWNGFNNNVARAVSEILISHKKNNKTLTKTKKGYGVRGQLHKDFVFGKRQAPGQELAYHRRKKITEITDHKLVGKIVDNKIKELIRNYLSEKYDIDVNSANGYKIPIDAFYKNGKWQLSLPNKNGEKVPIKKVRIKEVLGNAAQLKSNLNQYVNPRNNHHVMIYKNEEGKLSQCVVQFWTVIERKRQGEEIYQLPEDGLEVVTTLEINDMFLLGLSDEQFESIKENKAELSNHLYRVQKISDMYYNFRHHLASTLDKKEEEIYIVSMKAWEQQNPIKVKIDMLGELVRV